MTDARWEIILWRHAEAEEGLDDLARALTEKGQRQASQVGHWLNARLPSEARILVSPAVRAQQTAQGLGRRFETVKTIAPGASPEAILTAIGWPQGSGGVCLVVGHQPTLGQVAAQLLTGQGGNMGLKKGGALWLCAALDKQGYSAVLKAAMTPAALKAEAP